MSVYKDEPVRVIKMNTDKQEVSGWAYVSKYHDGSIPVDFDGDEIDAEVLRDAAIDYMLCSRMSGLDHNGSYIGDVVESVTFTDDVQKALGITSPINYGWFITVKVHDPAVFEKFKSGEYSMFSIEGMAEVGD